MCLTHGLQVFYLIAFNMWRYQVLNLTCVNYAKVTRRELFLGPVLFLLYINDLAYISAKLHFTLFADDMTVLVVDDSIKMSFEVASCELHIVFDWFIANRLCLNVAKIHFMLFVTGSLCADASLYVINNVIHKVQSTKFPGVLIDEHLCWHENVNMLHQIVKILGLLKAVSVYLPRNILQCILYCFF